MTETHPEEDVEGEEEEPERAQGRQGLQRLGHDAEYKTGSTGTVVPSIILVVEAGSARRCGHHLSPRK